MRGNDDELENKFFKGFIVVWVIGALVALGVAGVAIWAIVELVQWVTSK